MSYSEFKPRKPWPISVLVTIGAVFFLVFLGYLTAIGVELLRLEGIKELRAACKQEDKTLIIGAEGARCA